MNTTLLRYFLTLLVFALPCLNANAQNLVYDGDFNELGAGWVTSCVVVEATYYETTYGGTDPTNHVAEIDDQACMHQDVCVLPGASYIYTMDASRRTAGGPNPVTTHLDISGLDASGTVVATYVAMDFTRTNTVFALTPVTGIPAIVVPSGSGVVRLRITLTDNTPGYSTLGMIVDNISLVFATQPAIITGSSDTTCINTPIPFSVSGIDSTGVFYVWSFGAGATPATATSATPFASWNISGRDSVSVALGNGVCYVDTVGFNVYVNPAITVTLHDTTCSNVPYIFRGASLHISDEYVDTVHVTGGCDSIITLFLYVKPPNLTTIYETICNGSYFSFNGHDYSVAGIYTDTFLTATGCDSLSAINLTINAIPPKPIVPSVYYCQYDASYPLVATGSNIVWYGPGVTAGYSTAPTESTAYGIVDTYYVTQTVLGCTSDSAMAIVTVTPRPYPPVVSDVFYCQNQVATALTVADTGLLWYAYAVPCPSLPAAPVPSTAVPGITTYYVTQVFNGCESNKAAINVTVTAYPVFTVGSSAFTICQFDSADLYYKGDSTATGYLWSLPAGAAFITGNAPDSNVSVQFNVSGNEQVYLTVTGPGGRCTITDSAIIKVIPQPIAFASTPNNVCLGDTVSLLLANHSANAVSFTWSLNNAPLFSSGIINMIAHNGDGGGPFSISWNDTGRYIIGLYTTTAEGCRSATTYDSVNVNSIPDASFVIENNNAAICLEDSVLFKATTTVYGDYYLWSPASFFNNLNEPYAWGKIERGNSIVSLTVTDPYGCKATANMDINPSPCCTITFPDAFTPNGDGKNDFFRPIATGYHNLHSIKIVNRWGQTVFEAANNEMEWDGTFNGVPQDMGVYFYFISYDCGGNTLQQKGDVTLIR